MNIKRFASVFLRILLIIILNAAIISCTNNSIVKTQSIIFIDSGFQNIIASAFAKSPLEINNEDFNNIEGIDVYYYADRINGSGNNTPQYKDIWSITLYKKGYYEAFNAYTTADDEEKKSLISPYEFTYNDKLDNFSGYIDLKNFKNLRNISFSSEYRLLEINTLSFIAHMRSLETLYIHNYTVPDLSIISNFTNLKSLNVSMNFRQLGENQKIEYIDDITPLSNLKKLESLSLTGTTFTSFTPILNLENLKSLTVSMGGLLDISPVAELKSLEYVNFYYNGISDVTPLTKLPNLKKIILDYNLITDISPFSSLNPDIIEYVSLDMNSIDDVSPLKQLGKDKVNVGYELYWD